MPMPSTVDTWNSSTPSTGSYLVSHLYLNRLNPHFLPNGQNSVKFSSLIYQIGFSWFYVPRSARCSISFWTVLGQSMVSSYNCPHGSLFLSQSLPILTQLRSRSNVIISWLNARMVIPLRQSPVTLVTLSKSMSSLQLWLGLGLPGLA